MNAGLGVGTEDAEMVALNSEIRTIGSEVALKKEDIDRKGRNLKREFKAVNKN